MHVLYDYRVDELEEKVSNALDDLAKLLVSASRGASKRFASEGKRFRENCFNRLLALHVRKEEAENSAYRLIRRIRSDWFDAKRIKDLHGELEIDRDVDRFIRCLGAIEAEACTYVSPESDVDD